MLLIFVGSSAKKGGFSLTHGGFIAAVKPYGFYVSNFSN